MQTNTAMETGAEAQAADMVFESFFDDDSGIWTLRRVESSPSNDEA